MFALGGEMFVRNVENICFGLSSVDKGGADVCECCMIFSLGRTIVNTNVLTWVSFGLGIFAKNIKRLNV